MWADTEPSMNFRWAVMETYKKFYVSQSKRVGKEGVFLLFFLDLPNIALSGRGILRINSSCITVPFTTIEK